MIHNMQEAVSATVKHLHLDASEDLEEGVRRLARASHVLRSAAEALTATAGAIGVLNGMSARSIAEEAQIRHDTMRRALARSVTLQGYATGEGKRRAVTVEGIAQARKAIKDGRIAVGGWVNVADLPDGTNVFWSDDLGTLVVRGVAGEPTEDH